jgi:hypothetical protein
MDRSHTNLQVCKFDKFVKFDTILQALEIGHILAKVNTVLQVCKF